MNQTTGKGPLAGIRILDATAVISGPLATMMLADQGADVIKVEAPGIGDPTRLLGAISGGVSSTYVNCNRGKRAIIIDLRQEQGKDVLRRLVSRSDVFLQNFRPGVIERMGFGYEALRKMVEDLIYVSICGFGWSGPLAERKVYDNVVQALSGMAAAQTDPESGQPELVRNLAIDKATAYTVAQAVTAALLARERGAGGQLLRVSMLDVALAFFWPDGMMNQTFLGEDVMRIPPIGTIYRVYRTSDGYLTLAGLTDAEWQSVCRAIEREDLIDDDRLSTPLARMLNMDLLRETLAERLATRSTAEWCRRLTDEDVAHAPILSLDEVHEHEQVRANACLFESEHPEGGRLRQTLAAARFEGTPLAEPSPAPARGQHTDVILSEAGYSTREIATLRAEQVVA